MAGLEGTVKVPGMGAVKKKTAVYGGIGAVVLVLGVWWYRQRKASSSGSAASTGTATGSQATDPAGNTGTIDPATGYVYGSPEDQQALATASGYGAPYDTSQLGGGLGGYYYGPGGSTQTVPPGPGNFADNAEWAQYAETYMIDTLSADANSVGNALGKYITGQPVDSTQQNIVQEAIAVAGYPPVSGPGGYPPNIRTSSGGGGGGGGGSQTLVPNVNGRDAGEAHNLIQAAGLVPVEGERGQQPHWVVTSTRPAGGKTVTKGTRVIIYAKAGPHKPPPGTKVKVPNVVGMEQAKAFAELSKAGLHPTGPHPVKGKVHTVTAESPRAGTEVSRGTTVRLTSRLS